MFTRISRRISEVEKKIDDVYSLLQAGLMAQDKPAPQVSEQTGVFHQPVESSPVDSGLGYSVDFSPFSQADEPKICTGRADVVQKGIISVHDAEELVRTFQTDYTGFPFVLLPYLTMDSFRRERPFLLLSVLAITSRKQLELQEPLEREFREVLSTRVIVEGAKDLDLLQGLLIYLAWYHFHFKLKGGPINILVQIAVAMTIELDLGNPAQFAAEAKRAFVGIYYLSSCLSMMYRRPITMKYNDQVGECCQSLATGSETPSDTQLIHFIELQRLTEEMVLAFEDDPVNEERQWIGLERASLLVKAFKPRLQYLRNSFPENGGCLPSILLAYDSTCIYLHQVSLHLVSDKSSPTSSDPELYKTSGTRMNLLVGCLDVTKSFLDRYLQLSRYTIEHYSMLEKGPVAQATLILMRLAFYPSSGPERFPLRQACNVPYYLDALAALIESISVTPAHADHQDWFQRLKVMGPRIKAWYEREESLEPIFCGTKPSDLKGRLQLAEIAKNEEQLMDFDIGNMDFLFAEGNNFWESA